MYRDKFTTIVESKGSLIRLTQDWQVLSDGSTVKGFKGLVCLLVDTKKMSGTLVQARVLVEGRELRMWFVENDIVFL
jgi:hypothetical protein